MRNKKELNTTISLLFTATPPLYRGVQRFEVLRFRQIFELSFAVLANRCAVSVRFCGPTSFGIWTPPVTKLQAKLRGSEGEGGGRRNLVKIRTNLKELSNFWLLRGGATPPRLLSFVPGPSEPHPFDDPRLCIPSMARYVRHDIVAVT